jgi:tetratricopeptide (TPR) repeat protein
VAGGGPEAKRAVQVVAHRQDGTRWFGSGYLVTGDLVITARHVLGDADDVTVRFIDAPGQVRNEPGKTVWGHEGVDVAVVRLLAAMPDLAPVQSVKYGRLIAEAECEAVGYPWFKLRGEDAQADAAHPGKYRDSHRARATCSPLSNTRSGTLELAVAATPSRHPDPERSAWEGMSGAAVFAGGALIAVLTDNFPKEGPGLLTARPVERWYTLPDDLISELRGLIGVPDAGRLIPVSAQTPPWPDPPKQLPARRPFVGRGKELSQLLDLLAPGAVSAPAAGAGVAAIVGLPGVGKTALVTEAGHIAREWGWFPGGQLFLDLRGYDSAPISAHNALGQLLLDLGVPASDIRTEEQARATQFRSKLAQSDVPLLIVLDNVFSHALQVRPLVPDKGPHRLLVTSRHSLPQLDARLLHLDVLSPDESVALMDRVLRNRSEDDNRVQEQPEAAAEVARLCGYLPLALRIATALLAVPTTPVTELATELAVQRARLDRLNDGENSVRAAFNLSYQHLATDEAMLFRLLSLNGSPDISLAAAAAVAGLTEDAAKSWLDRLVAAHLLDRTTGRPRWTMHDLLWEYAALAADKDPEHSREAARIRVLDYYNRICALAAEQIMPDAESGQTPATGHFESSAAALDWLNTERANLVAAVTAAAEHQQDVVAVALADHLSYYLRSQRRFAEKITTDQVRLDIARRRHDQPGAADALCALGVSLHLLSRFAEAADHYEQALVIDRELGGNSRLREARDLAGLGRARRGLGEFDAAEANLRAAAELRAAEQDGGGQRRALNELAMTFIAAGREADAWQIWKDMST